MFFLQKLQRSPSMAAYFQKSMQQVFCDVTEKHSLRIFSSDF